MLVATCGLCALALVATAVWPDLDITVARFSLLPPDSAWRPLVALAREIGRATPFVLLAGALIMLAALAARGKLDRPTAWRRAVFVALTLALGPGLLVNAGLKAHSHRPRPGHTIEVADGKLPFRPYYRFDGGCTTNCSFSSGEAASAFWTAGPALLTPPHVRMAAVAAALVFGAGVSASRLALGAHFLSDVAFSALLVLLLVLTTRRLFRLA